MDSSMVSALLILGSLALLILCPASAGQFSDFCHQNSSIHIATETSVSGFNFNSMIGSLKSTPSLSAKQRQRSSFPSDGKVVFRIGVQVRSNITAFSVGVFEEAVRRLPYKFPYQLIPFDGSSDELLKEMVKKTFDVAVGDIVITSNQHQFVEFSLPYLEPGFMMVVASRTNEFYNIWWFLSPFTPVSWIMIAAFSLLTRVVIWIIEVQNENGPNFLEVLFSIHRQPFKNNAARILSILWVLVMIIFFQFYIRLHTIMLESSQQKPSISDFDSLKWSNAAIGCDGQPQTISYLVKDLGFKRRNIRIIDDYADALSSGNIKAVFLLTPSAEVFLAKHCADFIEINPTYGYNLSGLGFVFPKGSALASDISATIVELEESGELRLMEAEMLSFSDCTGFRPIGPSVCLFFFQFLWFISVIAFLITLIKLC